MLHYYYYYYYYYILILQIERGSVRDRVWNGDDEFDEFDVVVVFLSLGVGGWGCLLYTSPSPRD